jgi:hypothetical protein
MSKKSEFVEKEIVGLLFFCFVSTKREKNQVSACQIVILFDDFVLNHLYFTPSLDSSSNFKISQFIFEESYNQTIWST